ncbi:MAG: M28 family peptidase, partial [Candidatus Caldarchaeum sp.]
WKHVHQMGLGKYFPDRVGTWISDDHLPLNQVGIPTMDLIDFDYPAWHTTDDTPERCSPASLSVVGRAVESFLRAESPGRE